MSTISNNHGVCGWEIAHESGLFFVAMRPLNPRLIGGYFLLIPIFFMR